MPRQVAPQHKRGGGNRITCMATDADGVIEKDVVENPDPVESCGGIAFSWLS